MARNKYPEETVKRILDEAMALFIEKGYDDTSIQGIVDQLGGLSKGAIYHHFKSKEEIFEAVCEKMWNYNMAFYDAIIDDQSLNGYQKLRRMLESVDTDPHKGALLTMTVKLMGDSKFLMNQVNEIFELSAPKYVQPVIEQGIRDGSINVTHPKELAEVLLTLINIWANPVIAPTTPAKMEKKMQFFDLLMRGIGLPIFDKALIDKYVAFCESCEQLREI